MDLPVKSVYTRKIGTASNNKAERLFIIITDMVRDSVLSVSSSSFVHHTSLQKNVNGDVEP